MVVSSIHKVARYQNQVRVRRLHRLTNVAVAFQLLILIALFDDLRIADMQNNGVAVFDSYDEINAIRLTTTQHEHGSGCRQRTRKR